MGSMGGAPGQGGIPYANWGIDGATAQFGMQLGQNAMSAGQEYVAKNVCFHISQIWRTLY